MSTAAGLRSAVVLLQQQSEAPVATVPLREKVLAWARTQIGKRYAGPVVGEPDSYRWGEPGWDCSSFVAAAYRRVGVLLAAYTDAAAGRCRWLLSPDAEPGDIVFFRYYDPAQPGAMYPHMGLWLGDGLMLDAQYGLGVGVHPLLRRPYEVMRPRAISE